ncbi:MAG: hypothetical protein ACW975_08150, partial [Candidatus Thorarchaeota archaeon]
MNKEETLDFIDKQIEMELEIVKIVEENVSSLGNVFIKELLLGVSMDSNKHATLLKALRKAVEGPTPFISEKERDRIGEGIAKHIEIEAKAIETYQELADKSGSEQVKTIALM